MNNYNYLAEFLCTTFFSIMVFWSKHYLVIGLTLAFLIYINSKGAYNPGIALMLYNTGKISQMDLIIYIILEIIGFYTGYEIYKRFIAKII
jgi:glycerol uptake facilitator-like aquaporin